MMWIRKYSLYFAWLLSCIQSLGSLYYSNFRHFEPCLLCWYQRIALFPLVIILGIATYRNFFGIARYVLPQVILGLLLSLYQIILQELPQLNLINICSGEKSCSDKIYIGFSPFTVPMASAFFFFLITLFLFLSFTQRKRVEEED
ncbi:MAG: disulfide bond formation protein B [Chlamydiales bacterium]